MSADTACVEVGFCNDTTLHKTSRNQIIANLTVPLNSDTNNQIETRKQQAYLCTASAASSMAPPAKAYAEGASYPPK
jgi:hypothetical protein